MRKQARHPDLLCTRDVFPNDLDTDWPAVTAPAALENILPYAALEHQSPVLGAHPAYKV